MDDPATTPGGSIEIEVAYARPDVQRIVSVSVPEGTRVRAALALSGLADEFPEIDTAGCALGIFGQPVDDAYLLKSGDRIEIYRSLRVDPREARRERAKFDRG